MNETIELLVIHIDGQYGEAIYKAENELEAYRRFKSLKGRKKIVKAKVYYQNIMNTPFIKKYEVLETLA
ncbi:hypothetical protein [Clostridium manihotivorum]|uniref:Uncharacterized protein n=1 Tax=Clostridium manihotivorum TaxID=2320868 RepID=A0A410DPR8_9CLOT|nr:hypothetical protein [Clostridium manihotivorum]QAA31183.1 hypothetical protein C1I91_05610 [Clostridium manihotivorum]